MRKIAVVLVFVLMFNLFFSVTNTSAQEYSKFEEIHVGEVTENEVTLAEVDSTIEEEIMESNTSTFEEVNLEEEVDYTLTHEESSLEEEVDHTSIIEESSLGEVDHTSQNEETRLEENNEKVIEGENNLSNADAPTEEDSPLVNEEVAESPEEWLAKINEETDHIKKLELSIEANLLFPTDQRFIDEINKHADSLFNAASKEQSNGKYDVARTYYEIILNAPQVNSSLGEIVSYHNYYANVNKRTPEQYYEYAINQRHYFDRINLFNEGFNLYTNTEQEIGNFVQGLNVSAQILLNWSISKYEGNELDLGLRGLELILETTSINSHFKQTAESHHQIALHQYAMNHIHYTERLALSIKGYSLYPTNSHFVHAINTSANVLLSWTKGRHSAEDFEIALDRYNLILNAPRLDTNIIKQVEYLQGYANQNRLTPELYYNCSISELHYIDRLNKFNEGFQLFSPAEQRIGNFEQGLNISAQTFLNWSIQKYREKDYESAKYGMESVIASPRVNSTIKQSATDHLKTVLFDYARTHPHFTKRLDISIQAYFNYPSDIRFTDAINSSATSLMQWAIERQNNGEFEIAVERFDRILAAPVLDYKIKSNVDYHRSFAIQNKKTPEQFYNYAISQVHYTDRLDLSVEGYRLYNGHSLFRTAIHNSATTLFNWTKAKHLEEEYSLAIDRYNRIVVVPTLNSVLKRDVEYHLSYALQEKRTPEQFYKIAINQVHYTERLRLSILGYEMYSGNKLFVDGINSSAELLFAWAKGKHYERDFETALNRYNLILASPALNDKNKSEAEYHRTYAQQQKLTPEQYFDYAIGQFHFRDRITKFNEGFNLYNQSEQNRASFQTGLDSSARSLLNWTKGQHQNSQFEVARNNYSFIINAPRIASSIKEEARGYLTLAEKNIPLTPYKKIVNASVQNYTYAQMVKDIELLEQMYGGLLKKEIIGKSLDGRNIYAIKLGTGKNEVVFSGSSHAREHMTTNVLMKMIDEYAYAYMTNGKFDGFDVRTVLNNTSIWFIPMMNPDGVTLVQLGPDALGSNLAKQAIHFNGGSRNFTSWKANARGVDLNRQFPAMWDTIANNPGKPSESHYKGPRPLSEPEALAVYDFIRNKNFTLSVAYHSSGNIIYARNPGPVVNKVSQKTGYNIVNLTNSRSGGGLNDWFVTTYKREGFTPEISPYVGNRPVPLSNWNDIWSRNQSVGLIVADEAHKFNR
ncbi:M14 family zinc carboxypeptidase [Bacillus sp. FJAT-45066]|uniref:M14 family zinc carboxypeptidase n=1 Tax=Bacillus sp. FJAT-45066 TaxID=2011010 RepID=UPI000BB8A35D|nr:M14 family zinc carboxypeptidase [Bacillus sp. FJAT-45066]